MRLVNRQVLRPAVDLAGAGMNDGHLRSDGATQFKELQLRGAVDREIMVGRIHRVEVAGLRREIEQEVLPGQKMPHRFAIADIGDVDPHPVANVGNVRGIPAGLRHHAVNEQHLGAEPGESPGQGRADQAKAAGDHNAGIAKSGKTRIRTGRHHSLASAGKVGLHARPSITC